MRAESFFHVAPRGKREISSHVHAATRRSALCRALRKRMIDVPLFTPTFRRPHLCYHMTDVMSHYAPSREPVTEHDRDSRLSSNLPLFLPSSRRSINSHFGKGAFSKYLTRLIKSRIKFAAKSFFRILSSDL